MDEDLDSVISTILGYCKVGDPEKSEFPLFSVRLPMFDIYRLILSDHIQLVLNRGCYFYSFTD